MKRERKTIAKNRRAFHEYEILERFEAGIELSGTEVRSLRENNCQLTDCFVLIRGGEAWLHNVHIAPYRNGNIANVDPDRKRKLLLHKKEIRLIEQKVRERGMAVVPTQMYFKENSLVKVEIAVARGSRDPVAERQSIAERDRAARYSACAERARSLTSPSGGRTHGQESR